MGFRALQPLAARWQADGGTGLVHLNLRPNGERILADGLAIGDRDGTRYGVHFRITCGMDWKTQSLDLEATDGRGVHVVADEEARWSDRDGNRLPVFDGCVDIDLEGTPFTNTLPIRRLDLAPETGAVDLRMLYVPFDDFQPFVDEQRYRCVRPGHYRYEAVDGSFDADITVDEDGLVVDYPPLFRRLPL